MLKSIFPQFITNLPQAQIPIEGLVAYLVQGDNQQVLFMEFEKETLVPEHSHEAQWGIILEGRIELTLEGEILNLKKGDTYYIPAGTVHSAKIFAGYKDLTLFNQVDRYNQKQKRGKQINVHQSMWFKNKRTNR